MTYALGTSRGRITKAPLLLIDVETAEGVTGRAYLWSYFPRAMVGDREHPPGGRGAHQGRAHRAGRALEQARRALRADRRAGHRPHGDGGLRHRLLGRARGGGGRAAGAAARRRAAAHPGLQFLRARPDADGRAGRRGREAAASAASARSSCGSAIRRLPEDLAAVHAVKARIPARRRADGRLQPGAQPRRGAGARPRARPREHRLAGGADPARRLCRRGADRPRAFGAGADRREFFAARPECRRRSTPRPAIW